MFTNLIESESHRKEFKRRSSFFLATVAVYALVLFGAGIASIYAYDAHLEAQTSSLEVLSWVPPVTPAAVKPVSPNHQPAVRRSTPSNAPVDPTVTRPMRTDMVARTDDPTKVPTDVGTKASSVPVYTKGAVLGDRNVDPLPKTTNDSGTCITCPTTPPKVSVDEKPPEPPPVKPSTQRLPSTVLTSKAISLPQPTYPMIAKQIRAQGPVNVQILVDEQGHVLSAQAINGHPTLLAAAKEAALRARFTPTILNGQAVKVQGVITYNFVLQQ
jgi:protein TonB